MEAAEALVETVLQGRKQFLVPHFQRPYQWGEPQWRTLWDDVLDQAPGGRAPHFIGPIVTFPARSVPEGVVKRLLVDGQQRLTTIVIMLTAIREAARRVGDATSVGLIDDLVLNRHQKGTDRFKVLPTQGESVEDSDRAALSALVDGTPTSSKSGVLVARRYFDKQLVAATNVSPERLLTALANRVTLVSIMLHEQDNPYRIFESLNAKGRALSQADLIRNYFFMRLDQARHEEIHTELWRPMQSQLGEEHLTEFIRHDVMAAIGTFIRQTDVYSALQDRVDATDPLEYLRGLARRAGHYRVLLNPDRAPTWQLRAQLARLQRLDVTVAYPLLLPVYGAFEDGKLSEADVARLLAVIETFVLRRFVCGVPTYGLNKVFAPLWTQHAPADSGFVERVAEALAARGCPRDSAFRDRLQTFSMYGQGERREKTKLILERLEMRRGHKEAVDPASLTIEHVLPQTMTPEWSAALGPDAAEDHGDLLHTLGNLTLTGYNAELGNLPFDAKKARYRASNVGLNEWFDGVEMWNRSEIERRAAALAEEALAAWPWFGAAQPEDDNVDEQAEESDPVTGTVPQTLGVRGIAHAVRSWVEVAATVGQVIAGLGDDAFDRASRELPKFLNRDATAFRRSSKLVKLPNGGYVETNLSAKTIYGLTRRAFRAAGVAENEWSVTYRDPGRLSEGGVGRASERETLLLEFWSEVRHALVSTGKLPSVRAAHERSYFDIPLGCGSMFMSLSVVLSDRRVGARIVVRPQHVARAFPRLLEMKEEIEKELGFSLEWDPYPEKPTRTMAVWRPIDVGERANWPAAIAALTEIAVALHSSFAPRGAAIDL